MAAELSLLSLTQLQKLAQSQQNQNQQNLMAHGSWVWNPKGQQPQEADDDSWEVKAFAEDTGNVMGTTWPPRSYACTFCRREFRSAQALGGHMNVHRRDRARLHQTPPSNTLSPTDEFASNGSLCLLYQLPTPNGIFNSPSPYPFNNMMPPPGLNSTSSSQYYSITKAGTSAKMMSADINNLDDEGNSIGNSCIEGSTEELDLELRLGHRPTTS